MTSLAVAHIVALTRNMREEAALRRMFRLTAFYSTTTNNVVLAPSDARREIAHETPGQ